MKCFYHNDMDGKCAGAIVRKKWQTLGERQEQQYIAIDYKDEFPFDIIEENETVVIVDFSLEKPHDFEKLLALTDDVIWIDHHKTAIEKLQHISKAVKGTQEVSPLAGCGLTWEYFFPGTEIPHCVKLFADYDTWKFEHGDTTRAFQLGSQLVDNDPEAMIWYDWLSAKYYPNFEIGQGNTCKKYQDMRNKQIVEEWAFEASFEGHLVLCCNAPRANSSLFDSLPRDEFTILSIIAFDSEKWRVSIYANDPDVDCAAIAEKYGGGGHKGAAGFICEELPFKAVI